MTAESTLFEDLAESLRDRILAVIPKAGGWSTRRIAEDLSAPDPAVLARLRQMAAADLVHSANDGWRRGPRPEATVVFEPGRTRFRPSPPPTGKDSPDLAGRLKWGPGRTCRELAGSPYAVNLTQRRLDMLAEEGRAHVVDDRWYPGPAPTPTSTIPQEVPVPRPLRDRILELMSEPDTNWTVGEIKRRLPDVEGKSSVGAALSKMAEVGDIVSDGSEQRGGQPMSRLWRLATASPTRIRRAADSVPVGYPVAPVEVVPPLVVLARVQRPGPVDVADVTGPGDQNEMAAVVAALECEPDIGVILASIRGLRAGVEAFDAASEWRHTVEEVLGCAADDDIGDVVSRIRLLRVDLAAAGDDDDEHQRWVEALSAIARPDEGLSDALDRAINAAIEADEHVEPGPAVDPSAQSAIDTPPPGWVWSGSRWESTEPVDLDAIVEQAQRVVEARTVMERERKALARVCGVAS